MSDQIHKLFAANIPAATAAFAGGLGFKPEAQHFLDDEEDLEEVEANRAPQPIRRLFAEGVFRDALATPATQAPPARRLAERDITITPAKEKTETTLTYKFRQSTGAIFREGYDADNILQSCFLVEDAEEIGIAKRDPSFRKVDEPFEKLAPSTAEPESHSILDELKQTLDEIEPQREGEDVEDFVARLNARLESLSHRPLLSIE